MHVSFLSPTLKETQLFCVTKTTERYKVFAYILSFVSRLRKVRFLLSIRTSRIYHNVCCCMNDEEKGYQYLEKTFGTRHSFVEKKQKARKYDPRFFWENFVEREEKGKEADHPIRKKHGTTGNLQKAVFTNSTSSSVSGKPSKLDVLQVPSRNPKDKEKSQRCHLSTCPLAQAVGLGGNHSVVLVYLESPVPDSDIRTLLDIAESISCAKVTLILQGEESEIPTGYRSFVEMIGKENCYLDRQGCFSSSSSVRNCCVTFTCSESDAVRTSDLIQQTIQSLPNATWKVQLCDSQELHGYFCNSCVKVLELLSLREKYPKRSSYPEMLYRGDSSKSERAKPHPVKEEKARIVLNHSTYIPGLIKVLELLSQEPCVQTIVPGRLRNGKSRSPHLLLRVTTTTPTGFKLLARKGTTVQEVFVVTAAERQFMETIINKVNKLAAG